MPQPHSIYQVAVSAPLYQLFDYLAPDSTAVAPIGARVRVPFGRREAVGVLMGITDRSDVPRGRLKQVIAVLDAEPLFPAPMLKLITWAAGYYRHPLGE